MTALKSLIIKRAGQAPDQHWQGIEGRLQIVDGRRPAAYEIFDTRTNTGALKSWTWYTTRTS